MSFTIETEQENKISFLDVNVIHEHGEFITSVYQKPTFSAVYTHFDSFLPDTYKIGMIYTLANRCFRICSSCSMFHQQSILLREIFKKNGYPENFIDRCFKLFLDRIHILEEKVPTVEKKPLRLVLPYLGNILLQTFFCFFSIWVFFHEHSQFTEQQGKGEGICLTPLYHSHPLHRHLDIIRAITAESSPLHIAGSRTRTGNFWFPSAKVHQRGTKLL